MIDLILQYKYPLLIFIGIVEGPVISMVSGFLLQLGYLNFLPAYVSLMAGDLIGDVLWYALGFYGGMPVVRRIGKYFSITEKSIETVKRVFHKHHTKILFISKLTTGLGFALVTLFTAGLVKIPFRHYIFLNFLGQFIWTGLLLAIGYFLGRAYINVNNVFEKMFIIAGLALVFLGIFGFGRYMKNRTTRTYSS